MDELLTDNSTVNIKRIYGKQLEYPGFSKRFNELLDHCRFIGGRKRSRAVIEYFGKSRSVLYRCLKEDHCSKDIVNMVDKLYNDQLISKNVEQKKLCFGYLLQNPGCQHTRRSSLAHSPSARRSEIPSSMLIKSYKALDYNSV